MFFRSKKDQAAAEAPANGATAAAPAQAASATAPTAAPQPAAASTATDAAPGAPSIETSIVKGQPMDLAKAFAQITTLLMRTGDTRGLPISDLEWLVVPALKLQQFAIAEARQKDQQIAAPVGAVLWARVSPAVDQRLMSDGAAIARLAPEEWRSGDILWVVLGVGRNDVVNTLVGEMLKGPFKGRSIKVRAVEANGTIAVKALSAQA